MTNYKEIKGLNAVIAHTYNIVDLNKNIKDYAKKKGLLVSVRKLSPLYGEITIKFKSQDLLASYEFAENLLTKKEYSEIKKTIPQEAFNDDYKMYEWLYYNSKGEKDEKEIKLFLDPEMIKPLDKFLSFIDSLKWEIKEINGYGSELKNPHYFIKYEIV